MTLLPTVAIRTLVIGVVCISTSVAQPATSIPVGCRADSVLVTVLDPEGAVVPGSHIELRPDPGTALAPPTMRAVTDGNGVGLFDDVPCGTYELVSTETAFPARRLRVDVTAQIASLAIKLTLGVPCADESSPPLQLTDADSSAILSDLIRQARDYPNLTVLLNDNVDSLRRSHALPSGLDVLGESALLRRSRKQKVTFLHVAPLEAKGSCVVARWWISCVTAGVYCSLCCEGAIFTYHRVDGKWKGKYYWGAIS